MTMSIGGTSSVRRAPTTETRHRLLKQRGGFGIPMAERVALRDCLDPCPARHGWVLDPADHSGLQRPGLLVEWRHTDEDDWLGRVIYAAQFRSASG
jgi:hypothetical protein